MTSPAHTLYGIPPRTKSKHFLSLKAAQHLRSFIGPVPRACLVIPKNTLLVWRSWPAFRLALFGLTSTGQPSLHRLALKSALGGSRSCKYSVLRMLHVKLPLSRAYGVLWPQQQSYWAQNLHMLRFRLRYVTEFHFFNRYIDNEAAISCD